MVAISYTPRGYRGSTTDTTAPSYPEELRITDAVQTALDAVSLAARTRTMRVPLVLTANSTWATHVELPEGGTVTALALLTPTVYATGTHVFTVKKTSSAGNTMLSAASFDATTLVANTRSALTLTATAADLVVAANGLIHIAHVSDNGSATGPADAAAILTITYVVP